MIDTMKNGIEMMVEHLIKTELCDIKRQYAKCYRDGLSLQVTLQDDMMAYVNVTYQKQKYIVVVNKEYVDKEPLFMFEWWVKKGSR